MDTEINMAAMKLTLKSILAQSFLPGGGDVAAGRGRAEPGILYFCRDTQQAFLAMACGKLLSLAEVCEGRLERESALRSEIDALKARLAVLEAKDAAEKKYLSDLMAKAHARLEKQ